MVHVIVQMVIMTMVALLNVKLVSFHVVIAHLLILVLLVLQVIILQESWVISVHVLTVIMDLLISVKNASHLAKIVLHSLYAYPVTQTWLIELLKINVYVPKVIMKMRINNVYNANTLA